MVVAVDSDQHLFERRHLWADYVDPDLRQEALSIVDDDLGYPWVRWRGQTLGLAEVPSPGKTAEVGQYRQRQRDGLPAEASYEEQLPATHWQPSARVAQLDRMGLSGAVLFPNFGLMWERSLSDSVPALTANMGAWNRWCAEVQEEGAGHLHPVGHLTLRDPHWVETQLAALSAADVRLAMIAPAAVDGRPLSHPDHDRLWQAFVDHGVAPVFHVADQPRVLDDAFYGDKEAGSVPVMESVFLWVPVAVAVTDLIVNGVLDRFPDLRLGIVELSSVWVPQYLMMLDGGWHFTAELNGRSPATLPLAPSEYFRRQVRVSSFSYEQPGRLMASSGDIFMCCSDYPHSEGTATPLEDYERSPRMPDNASGFYLENLAFLLGD